MKKRKHGGARKDAGRKPVLDKKITLIIYPRTSEIEAVGGKEKAREIALNAIKNHTK
jgi:hypothetical protein